MPNISVIMPTYNADKYLNEAIESILNQTYTDFEFIIINDGSTDNSLNIINFYMRIDNRIILIDNGNKGFIASLNEGIEMAKGNYIARMDADDISLPQRFEKQLKLMEEKNADICGCHFFIINENSKYIDTQIMPLTQQSFILFLSDGVPFAHGSVMISKKFLKANNLKYGQARYAIDYELWVTMFENKASFINVDEFLFKYRIAKGSLSRITKHKKPRAVAYISRNFIKNNILSLASINDFKDFSTNEKIILVRTSFNMLIFNFNMYYFKIIKKIHIREVLFGTLGKCYELARLLFI